jgi:hypothetical protein
MFSRTYSFVHIASLCSFSVHVMIARDYWKESSTLISSSVAVQGIHCVSFVVKEQLSEQLQIHVNYVKLFAEMKLYLTQNFSGWSGDNFVTEVQKVMLAKVRDQNSEQWILHTELGKFAILSWKLDPLTISLGGRQKAELKQQLCNDNHYAKVKQKYFCGVKGKLLFPFLSVGGTIMQWRKLQK